MDMTNVAEIASQAPQWQDRDGRAPIGMERWGRDHWSLLGYVETVAVDHHGLIEWARLTLSHRHWPALFQARRKYSHDISYDAADRYPLRLKSSPDGDKETAPGQCEGDALMDLLDAGLITLTMPPADLERGVFLKPSGLPVPDSPDPTFVTGMAEWQLMPWAKFGMTPQGLHYSAALRAHKSAGGNWSDFTPPAPPAEEK
jgi:hypothetical protein